MFCRICGNQLNDNARVCSKCGAYIAGNQMGMSAGAQAPPATQAPVATGKSKIAAGLLGIFVGCYGVHNFYLGYTKKAVAQLVIYLVSYAAFWLFYLIGIFLWPVLIVALLCAAVPSAIWVWTLIEGILILCGKIRVDGKGNPLVG